ncbi:MAG: Gfo/Idh/MocA family oxidoreductase [Caldilineaceae bacterium]|nr:Gfo/Idh/MocA family oxidoreductase [Caldilineaceae bacterium]
MTARFRIGFIGAGRMANIHAGHLQLEHDVTIVAAADIDADRAAGFTAQWGGAAYTDHRAMLDHEELDAVYICTPTATHARLGLDAAERDLHLFVEKPLDLDLAAATRLVHAVERRNLIAMTGFQWRYTEGYQRAAELIGDEPVALVNLRWYWTRPPIRWMWDRSQAGGQLVDQNIHLVDVSLGLAGPVDTVYAIYNERQANQEPEFLNWDAYAVTLHYRSGAVGVSASTYALFPEIQEPPAADFALRDRLVRVTDRGASLFVPSGVQEWPNSEPLHRGVNRAFIAALRAGDPKAVKTPLRSGLIATAVVLAANESAHTGQPVAVPALPESAPAGG